MPLQLSNAASLTCGAFDNYGGAAGKGAGSDGVAIDGNVVGAAARACGGGVHIQAAASWFTRYQMYAIVSVAKRA